MSLAAVAIMAGASLAAGAMQADAAQSAANTQYQGTQKGISEQRRQFDLNRADLAPYRQLGAASTYTLADLLGLGHPAAGAVQRPRPTANQFTTFGRTITGYTPKSVASSQWDDAYAGGQPIYSQTPIFDEAGFNNAMSEWQSSQASTGKPWTAEDFLKYDPGYAFQQQQGEQAINRASAAQGRRLAPSTLKELLRFNQGLASTSTAQTYNRLMGTAGLGMGATTAGVNSGNQNSMAISDLLTQGANARAAGTIGAANAMGGAVQNVGSNVFQYLTLKDLLGKGGGGAGFSGGI